MFQKLQLSVADWVVFFILMLIPLVNIVIVVVVLLDDNSNLTLRNYIKTLIFFLVILTLFLIGTWSVLMNFFEGLSDDSDVTLSMLEHILHRL